MECFVTCLRPPGNNRHFVTAPPPLRSGGTVMTIGGGGSQGGCRAPVLEAPGVQKGSTPSFWLQK